VGISLGGSPCSSTLAPAMSKPSSERVEVFKAVSEGERELMALAVDTSHGGAPCGACRQVRAEFGLETLAIIADDQGQIKQEATLAELLPGAFGPGALGKQS
jgi:cytidine deaminase